MYVTGFSWRGTPFWRRGMQKLLNTRHGCLTSKCCSPFITLAHYLALLECFREQSIQAMQERVAHLEDQLSEVTQQLDSSETQLQVTNLRF